MAKPVVIENPVINSPFEAPGRHFRFDNTNNITDTIADGRRESCHFVPIAAPRKKAKGLFDSLLAEEKKTESDHVNRIRARVKLWRDRDYPDVTPVTQTLLEHWTKPDRDRRLFFCQVEALETLIFVTEVAKQTKYGDAWIAELEVFRAKPRIGVQSEPAAPGSFSGLSREELRLQEDPTALQPF